MEVDRETALTTKHFLDKLPEFTLGLKNMSVPIERDVTFTCHVKNIGLYRVRMELLSNLLTSFL